MANCSHTSSQREPIDVRTSSSANGAKVSTEATSESMPTVSASDILTFDRILAVVGFGIAIWQILKTRAAAEAATQAAHSAVASVQRLSAATKLHDIVGRSREVLRLLRSRGPAAPAALELREAVSRYRTDPQAEQVVSEAIWTQTIQDVKTLHDRIESIEMLKKASPDDRQELVVEISRLHSHFSELAAKAAAQGLSNADSA